MGRVAIVTGGTRGIGEAISVGLKDAGYNVAAIYAGNDEAAKRFHEKTGIAVYKANVSDFEACEKVMERIVEDLGPVDVLVNNAGIAPGAPATRESPEQFRSVIDINLNGCYWMAQACGRVMEPGSSVVNIGSVLGSTSAFLPQAAYASSKAAIIGLTRDLAQQWTGRKGIRVNALAPGFFASEMTDQYPDGYLDQIMLRVPAGRKGEARELVAAALFLASDAASYVTGIVLPVDGGTLTS